MASVTVSSNPSTTGNTLTVNFTTDATNITDVQITKDGSNYSSATTFTNTSAIFDVSSWSNGTYNNCYLKVIHSGGSSGGGTTSDVSGSFGALLKTSSTWYVIGDSISDTGLLPQRKYMTVLGEAFPNVTITNVGKDGSHFTNKTTGYSTFASLLDKLPSTAPNVVTVFGGVNDFIQSCSIGTISSRDTTDFYGAVKSFVSNIKTKYSSSKIIFILPLNMRAGAFSTNSDGTNSLGNTLQDYRDVINSVCTDNNIAVIDLHSDSELQPDLISSDGLHPNQDGHALLASKLRASIVSTSTIYKIDYTLGNATSSNPRTSAIEGSTYSTTITTNSGYEFDTVHVVMGGNIIDDTAITSKTSTTANITISGVTSDVYITVVTTATSSGSTDNYINATVDQFHPEGNCDGIAIDTGGNLTASTIGQWGMVRLGVPLRKLRFTVRTSQADYGALCWYIYNNNGDGTYNMLALGDIVGGENGKTFLMTIPGTQAGQMDKLNMSTINPGETLTIEMSGSTQTIKREDGTTLITLSGNMSGWCGQSTNSTPFCSNVQYVE